VDAQLLCSSHLIYISAVEVPGAEQGRLTHVCSTSRQRGNQYLDVTGPCWLSLAVRVEALLLLLQQAINFLDEFDQLLRILLRLRQFAKFFPAFFLFALDAQGLCALKVGSQRHYCFCTTMLSCFL
jgi:hypothetical protein